MKKFEFKSKVEPISICDKEYTFDVGNVDWLTDVIEESEKTEKALEEIQSEEGWNREKINKVIAVLGSAIDTILGEGVFEVIFNSEECKRNVNYMTKLCNFLLNEVKRQSSGL